MTGTDTSRPLPTAGLGMIYWLDAAPPEEWPHDFDAMRQAGASFVIIADWFDLADVFREEVDHIGRALDVCQHNGLKACLHVFPAAQMLEPYPIHFIGDERFSGGYLAYRRSHEKYKGGPTHRMVDAFGYLAPFYDLFSLAWQDEWFFPYLDAVIGHYGRHPAVAGYEFSNLLLLPLVRADAAAIMSYSDEDSARFRQWREQHGKAPIDPPVLPGRWSEDWCDWMAARRQWLAEWAVRTVRFIHERSPGRAAILHDDAQYLVWSAPLCGGYTPEMASAFDAFVVEHYFLPRQLDPVQIGRQIDIDLATAASLVPNRTPGWRAQCHTRCGDACLSAELLRQMLEATVARGVRRIEIDCYRRPRVPGHVFDYQQTLHARPEMLPVMRDLAHRLEGG